jgi:hypothetical protein
MTIRTTGLNGSDWIDGANVSTIDMKDTWDKQAQVLLDFEDNTSVPVGTIIAWHKTLASAYYTLPSSWKECDGSVVSDAGSPLNGVTLPNINAGYFLRASNVSGGIVNNSAGHSHTMSGGPHGYRTSSAFNRSAMVDGTTSTTYAEPPYMDVVFIIKVK